MGEWIDISAAPKDGTRIILYFPVGLRSDARVEVGRWVDDRHAVKPRPYFTISGERSVGVVALRKNQPTHWMPLPGAPKND